MDSPVTVKFVRNFVKSLVDCLVRDGNTFHASVRIAIEVEVPEMQFLEEKVLTIRGIDYIVLRGGPDRDPWYNFKRKV